MTAVILFGAPGSGKGTQARLLRACLGVPHVSTGEMLRDRVRRGDVGDPLAAILKSGALVSDEVVNEIVAARLAEPDAQAGFVLDGYPRTRAQAEFLDGLLQARGLDRVVIHLVLDYNIVIARLSGRRECPCCGALYNTASHPPRQPGICDVDGCGLVVRDDDTEPVIRERLEAYERQMGPLLGFYREKGRCMHEIDAGHLTPEALFDRVCRSIRNE